MGNCVSRTFYAAAMAVMIVNLFLVFPPSTMGTEWTLEPTSVIGGYRDGRPTAVSGDYVYFGEGNAIRVASVTGDTPQLVASYDLGGPACFIYISGNYLYTACAETSQFEVLDISDPLKPSQAGSCHVSAASTDSNSSSWDGNRIYMSYYTYGTHEFLMEVMDVSDPGNPSLLAPIEDFVPARRIHVSSGILYASCAYQETQNAETNQIEAGTFRIYDVSVISNVVRLGELSSTDDYTLSEGSYITKIGSTVYISCSGYPGKVQMIDVQNTASPAYLAEYTTANLNPKNIQHHNGLWYIGGDSAGLVVVDLSDPANPANEETLSLSSSSNVCSIALAYPYAYLLSNGSNALSRVDVTDPSSMLSTGCYKAPSFVNFIFQDGNTLFASSNAGLWVFNMENPELPELVSIWTEFPIDATTYAPDFSKIAVENGKLYGLKSSDLYVLDVSDTSAITHIGKYDPGIYVYKLDVYNGFAYLTENDGTVQLFDSANPEGGFSEVGSVGNMIDDLWVGDGLFLVANSPNDLGQVPIYEIGSDGALIHHATITTTHTAIRCSALGDYILVSENSSGNSADTEGILSLYRKTESSFVQLASTTLSGMVFNDLSLIEFSDGDVGILASGYLYEARRSSAGSTNGVHTFLYNPVSGTLTKGDVCKSAWPDGMTVSSPSSDSYNLTTNDASSGLYSQSVSIDDGLCCVTASVYPKEAVTDGCTASVGTPGRVPCGTAVGVTAVTVEPWNFQKWMGALPEDSSTAIATAGGNCTEATAFFVKPILTLTPGPGNPGNKEVYGQNPDGEEEQVAGSIMLSASDDDDWQVSSITFVASGSGNEVDDITKVRLRLSGAGGALLGEGVYSGDNGNITLSAPQLIPAGTSSTFVLTYEFNAQKACPCNTYQVFTNMSHIAAEPVHYTNRLKEPAPPEGVSSGPVKIIPGMLTKEGDLQSGKPELPLEKDFKLTLTRQHPDCVDKVSWELKPEAVSYGAKFSNNDSKINTYVDASGVTNTRLTLGEKAGMKSPYIAEYTLLSKGADCGASIPVETFTAYGNGLEVTLEPEHDGTGSGDANVGTFISSIDASNKLTVKLDMAPEDMAEVKSVTYKIGESEKTGTMVTQNEEYYAVYDMKNFEKDETFLLTIELEDSEGNTTTQEKTYQLKACKMPDWYKALEAISEQIKGEFNKDDEVYQITFEYPTNFVWSDTIPSNMGYLGGLGNDLGVEFKAEADYFITENTDLKAECSSEPKILGHEFSLEGTLKGEFDKEFKFQRGYGTVYCKTKFGLGSKSFSKTILVGYIPITVGIDISGKVTFIVDGSVTLNKKLEIQKAELIPSTIVRGRVNAYASALLGVAKVGASGYPSILVKIKITYTKDLGTSTTWYTRVKIPVSVYASLFWGKSGKVANTVFGPWTYPEGGGGWKADEGEEVYVPRLATTTGLSSNILDERIAVWIEDTEPNADGPNPDVYYSYFDGADWTSPAPVTSTSEWETDPQVVYLAGSTALAAWTTNDGDPSLENLNDILAAQDIAYSVWSGSEWAVPGRVIDDGNADGSVDLAYDPLNNVALAAWVHDSNNTNDVVSRTDWAIYTSIYDIDGGEWSTPSAISGTDILTTTGAADYNPALSANTAGQGLLVWCRDGDGQFFTSLGDDVFNEGSNVDLFNDDADVYWSLWSGEHFTAGTALTAPNTSTENACDVACGPVNLAVGGSLTQTMTLAVAVWASVSEAGAKSLQYRVFDFSTQQWGTPGIIAQDSLYIEDPRVVVDSNGVATAVWRGSDDVEGDLFFSQAADLSSPQWSSPEKITDDSFAQTSPSIALDSNGKILTSYSAYDLETGDTVSGEDFGGSINVARANPGTASIIGNWNEALLDSDQDGVFEALVVSLDVEILKAGDYEVRADLFSETEKIADTCTDLAGTTVGTHTVQLVFDGALFTNDQVDGPYYIKNLMVIDKNGSAVVAVSENAPYATAEYSHGDFIKGPLAIDKDIYLGLNDSMIVTLTRADLNTSSFVAETAEVRITSTEDPDGLPLMLTETGPDTGVFRGSLSFSIEETDNAVPAIFVLDHTVVRATWYDASSYPWSTSGVWTLDPKQGDLDLNGIVDVADAITILQVLSGLDPEFNVRGYTSVEPWLGEEEALATMDALYILQTVSQTP